MTLLVGIWTSSRRSCFRLSEKYPMTLKTYQACPEFHVELESEVINRYIFIKKVYTLQDAIFCMFIFL